jgi:hypothetical protein
MSGECKYNHITQKYNIGHINYALDTGVSGCKAISPYKEVKI